MTFNLNFIEMMQTEGLYRAGTFADGMAFKVKKDLFGVNELFVVNFKDENDLYPKVIEYRMNVDVVSKAFTKITNTSKLFGHYTIESFLKES